MFEIFYNSLLNFEKRVENGLVCGVMDFDLGIKEKVQPYITIPVSEEIKRFGENTNPIKLDRNIL